MSGFQIDSFEDIRGADSREVMRLAILDALQYSRVLFDFGKGIRSWRMIKHHNDFLEGVLRAGEDFLGVSE